MNPMPISVRAQKIDPRRYPYTLMGLIILAGPDGRPRSGACRSIALKLRYGRGLVRAPAASAFRLLPDMNTQMTHLQFLKPRPLRRPRWLVDLEEFQDTYEN